MTAHYIHAMKYECDGDGCSATAQGTNVDLPEGWTSRVAGEGKGPGSTHWYEHLCPKCSKGAK